MVLTSPTQHQLAVPLGSRAMIVGSLELSVTDHPAATPSTAVIARELSQWEGPGALILTGACFRDRSFETALERHRDLFERIRAFAHQAHRSVLFVLDPALATPLFTDRMADFSIDVVDSLELICTTAVGERRIMISSEAGVSRIGDQLITGASWLDGAELLEDPSELLAFTQSRTLYRRLSKLVWIPPVLALIVALVSATALVNNTLTRIATHAKGNRKKIISEITSANWGQRILVAIVAVIVVVGALTFIPADALGPVADQLTLLRGTTY